MEHNNNELTDMDASPNSDGIESSAQPTQITSIDGFFNRKRGRPPKNRFVEVYKSAQHSPQAIFTSFKLEKNDQTNTSGLVASTESTESSLPPLRVGTVSSQATQSGLIPTDLTPSRTRKRGRVWTVEPQRELITISRNEKTKSTLKIESNESRSPDQEIFSTPNLEAPATSKCLERVSVVRAAGTFYPENASTVSTVETTESPRIRYSPTGNKDLNMEQPEDLSMRGNQKETSLGRGEPEAGLKLMQFKQLIDLYQRQWLLPSFLAAASSQPATLDMRLLLQNAAQQKMLLLNAAAAGAVAAATATAATAAAAPTATVAATTEETTAIETTPITASIASTLAARGKRERNQDIPTGYLKFRFNEDCNFERCGYRNHQSHFHCNRRDCHYSFCDKTRFVQHTARHERMDTLMGDDFRQYRANMRCGVIDCCFATPTPTTTAVNSRPDEVLSLSAAPKKSSHFHCRKCDYVCTDSNKVVAHRRLHMRLEYVRSAGFRKIASNESCDSPSCSYALRHTHYHCNTCDCSVLSRAQLGSHRHRISQSSKQLADSLPALNGEQEVQTYP